MKSKNPLATIIVATFNSSKFVIETLESCKSQSYKNIELIITDDCSTDNTVQVCKYWVEKNKYRFKGVKIIESIKNTGISGNLNRGVNACSGLWFKPLAGDDILLDNCISDNVIEILKRNDLNIGAFYSIKSNFKNKIEYVKKTSSNKTRHNNYFNISPNITVDDQYALALRGISPAIVSWVVKKDAFDKVGGCDEGIAMHDDGPLLLRLLKGGYKFCKFNKETVLYRKNSDSITQRQRKEKIYKDWIVKYYFKTVQKYVYPNVSILEQINIKYKINLARLFIVLNLNRRTHFNLFLNKTLIFPSVLLSNYYKNKIKNKIKNKYYIK